MSHDFFGNVARNPSGRTRASVSRHDYHVGTRRLLDLCDLAGSVKARDSLSFRRIGQMSPSQSNLRMRGTNSSTAAEISASAAANPPIAQLNPTAWVKTPAAKALKLVKPNCIRKRLITRPT
jgi:hypothetical protein